MKKVELTLDLISSIEMALGDNSYETEWYFDLETGSVTFISDYYDDEEELAEQIEADRDGERFIYIEPADSRDEWTKMRDFILDLDDIDDIVQSLLLRAIEGSGAFRRFKDAIHDVGVADKWYEMKNLEDRKKALEWLREHNLIDDADVEKGIQMHKDAVERRNRTEQNREMMTKGRQVVCTNSHGHFDKISLGKSYEILDDRPADLLIRIKDDRGKVVWLPKSHFELI